MKQQFAAAHTLFDWPITRQGGKQHSMPCHYALVEALRAYIDAASFVEGRKPGGYFVPHGGALEHAQEMAAREPAHDQAL